MGINLVRDLDYLYLNTDNMKRKRTVDKVNVLIYKWRWYYSVADYEKDMAANRYDL